MTLDSKQKRGSATLLTMPWRSWLAEPDGSLAVGDRLSLLKLCSAVAPAESFPGPWRAVAGQVYVPGGTVGHVYAPGAVAGEIQ